ncbi:ribonuclease H-like domain-containing protein [Tanacetum coccineum]
MRLIQSLASKELVRNLPKLKFDQHFCNACKIGKQAHASHKAKNIVSMTRCLELLHMDLFGPSAVQSYGGNHYTLVIVDDYSRYTWTRFLKDKTEAFDQFEIFSKKIQNQLGCTIVSIRTDHGREFDNEVQFGEFCNANGITHNFSAPRTPQSNGVVERKNRTLQEMSRTMLNEQSLPQKFWCNAVDTSTYILNRILIRAILGKTPYELLKGRKPTLDYFRVFGRKCFILNTKDYLTKFDPKSYEVNGDSVSPIALASASADGPIPPKTAKQKLDAKSLWEAIKNSQEGLDKTYDRFQKLISQLEIHGEVISQEDANLKLLRSLPSAWNNIALIMRNKSDLDTLSMDDLYNNLKVYESEIKGKSSSSSNSQNVAFVSSDNSSSTNETINTAYNIFVASSKDQSSTASYVDDVMISFFSNQSNAPQLDYEDLEQIDADDLEEIDLKWQVAMLTMRVKRFIKKTRRKMDLNDKETVGFDRTKVECYNCHRRGHFARECRAPRNQGNRNRDAPRRNAPAKEGITNFALMAYTYQDSSSSSSSDYKLENALKEKDDLKLKLEKFKTSSKNLTKLINSQITAKDKTGLGFDEQVNESEVLDNVFDSHESDGDDNPVNDDSVYKTKVGKTETSISKTSKDIIEKPKTVRPSDLIIEEWDTDSDNESVFRPKSDQTKPKFTKINFVKSGENVKSFNKENIHRQVEYPRKSQSPRGNRRNWNRMMTQKLGNGFEFIKKACFVCGSFNHLIKDCDFHDNKMVEKPMLNNKGRITGQREIRPVWNKAQRVNHQNKLTHPHPKRNFVPTVLATKSGQVLVKAAKQSSPRAAASISTARPVNTDAPKSKGNPQYTLQDQGIFNSRCSRHMTGYKSFLIDYQEIDGGFVAFAGSAKGGKITGKGKIRTEQIDFKDVYFVKELKFNLFSVSQMYDKKNSVLFTDNECVVLSPDFKLLDESQVLLKVPRNNNMYSFDLKDVVPSGGLTCLFAKATLDESNLWHRRLGHINFKTMNKLVRGNLVRGLSSKLFENDQTCVACQKGKQHKASCKTMTVFFLATKDETPEILKNFITGIENQTDHKVKTIRCDNGTEFKNRSMNEFCEMKGIRREFSVARTPQQNGVAERKIGH